MSVTSPWGIVLVIDPSLTHPLDHDETLDVFKDKEFKKIPTHALVKYILGKSDITKNTREKAGFVVQVFNELKYTFIPLILNHGSSNKNN